MITPIRISHFLNDNKLRIYTFLFVFVVGTLFLLEINEIKCYFDGDYKTFFWKSIYESFDVSDWLINYEGGFVRRGITGQILLELYKMRPYNVLNVIVFIHIISTIWFLAIITNIFYKDSLSLFILPFPIMFCSGFLTTRRDFLTLIFAYYLLKSYNKFLDGNNKHMILFQILSLLVIIFYEPSFFYIFPILLLHYYMICRNHNRSKFMSFVRTLLLWSPALLSMALVCIYKGNATMADAIWQSWYPMLHTYPYPADEYIPTMGAGVGFLTNSTPETILFHLHMTWLRLYKGIVPAFPIIIFILCTTYYLLTRINQIAVFSKKQRCHNVFDNIRFGNIMIIQFISLIPLWGLLSCDLFRVIPYWTVSSLLMYHYLNWQGGFPIHIERFVKKLQKSIESIQCLNSKIVYFTLLFFASLLISPLSDRFPHTPIDLRQLFFRFF